MPRSDRWTACFVRLPLLDRFGRFSCREGQVQARGQSQEPNQVNPWRAHPRATRCRASNQVSNKHVQNTTATYSTTSHRSSNPNQEKEGRTWHSGFPSNIVTARISPGVTADLDPRSISASGFGLPLNFFSLLSAQNGKWSATLSPALLPQRFECFSLLSAQNGKWFATLSPALLPQRFEFFPLLPAQNCKWSATLSTASYRSALNFFSQASAQISNSELGDYCTGIWNASDWTREVV